MSPLYGFECSCGDKQDIALRISKRNDVQTCAVCGSELTRVISCKIERLEPTYLMEMVKMLPKSEQSKVYDRISFKSALDRSGLITI